MRSLVWMSMSLWVTWFWTLEAITSSITLTLLQHVDVVIDTTGNPSVIGKEDMRLNLVVV